MSENIELKRGKNTMAAVEDLSKYIKSLNLPKEENNKLVGRIMVLLTAAEMEQFLQGLKIGVGCNTKPKKKYVIGKEGKVKPWQE